jgi:hypothetical protein
MKFERTFIKQAICEIRFNPILNYHQNRIEICNKFYNKLPHWWLDITRIDMYDKLKKEESQRIFTLTSRGASLTFKDVGHYDNFKSLSVYLLENVTSDLEIKQITRFGVRLYYLVEYKNSFKKLRDLMAEKIYKSEFIKDFETEKEITDIGCAIDFNQKDIKFHIVSGPVSKKEIEKRFGRKEKEISKAAILFDLDCYMENTSSAIIKKFLKSSYENSQIILEKMINYLREE